MSDPGWAVDGRNDPLAADPSIAADAGRRRRLLRLAGSDGIVAGIALDHRDSLRVVLARQGLAELGDAGIRAQKLALARALAPAATAVMLDAEFGRDALETGAVPAGVGLIMPLEAQGYEAADVQRASLLDDFSPLTAATWGADACKLLLPYRVDDEVTSTHHDALVRFAVRDCHRLGLPLIVEPLVNRRPTDSPSTWAAAYPGLVAGAVERLRPLGVDLLKLPFPATADTPPTSAPARAACDALARACGDTPWVVLGAGVDLATLIEQIRTAGMAGACGFLVGRSIWGGLLRAEPAATEALARTTGRVDFTQVRTVGAAACQVLAPVAGPDRSTGAAS